MSNVSHEAVSRGGLDAQPIVLSDSRPKSDGFCNEVLRGLRQQQKEIPSKYFYDERGSRLFDRICELEDYYPTRTETAIMREHVAEMIELLGPSCLLIEYGSGSSTKARILLDHLREPAAYVPVDISCEHLLRMAADLRQVYPGLRVLPVCADYTAHFELPDRDGAVARSAVYFPGSTVGNFHPEQARGFLRHVAEVAGPGGALLIGVDLKKDPRILETAYNDREGVTAAFNLNVLARINRELGAEFDLDAFRHHAFYNEDHGRIEMHLVSLRAQTVHVGDVAIAFREGETIFTESSYKYDRDEFARLVEHAGWSVERVWTDAHGLFSVQYCSYSAK
jgi:dimethylhistidine N-methyltransferase